MDDVAIVFAPLSGPSFGFTFAYEFVYAGQHFRMFYKRDIWKTAEMVGLPAMCAPLTVICTYDTVTQKKSMTAQEIERFLTWDGTMPSLELQPFLERILAALHGPLAATVSASELTDAVHAAAKKLGSALLRSRRELEPLTYTVDNRC